ncbi:MAG: bifunctional UDP-N-acetylglucosamine diphosphorylase/glucosamine-1-phosphate N-acetyltransferase GlmU [Candidatus Izemoplasmatales bacterium]|jgi:bifunctional UDP-N-acetylglucosamine pyrophosphorylase/glucosamine-1-phosphate N-acetyltransferase|nr:bifunctional UDP-N-acetylglucosamine diphosphorylase/glucosamine-1-phosphate N-acetyltransferase GlmU [Candidatus Izemoplasmatales bacterium]MDD3864791.1 bifunctional UDP-N-acetylglucosamine diphosphorylase/glucosamine-1-phosphate N-acetyltransferase GlmU [Candidatus Izemoplasmatales bacterium]
MKKYALVLAAGKGTRMKTEMPKCAYPLIRKPMIAYIVENIRNSHIIDETVVVVGHKREIIQEILGDTVKYAVQTEQLGTGHAVMVAEELISDLDGDTMILPGDMPLVDDIVIEKVFREHIDRRHDMTVMTTKIDDPSGYGRIIRNDSGYLDSIIEHHEATSGQRMIDEINTGMYVVKNRILFSALKRITNNNLKHEYYLTDIVNILKQDGYVIGTYALKESYKAMGVNDLYSLSIAEAKLRLKINKQHMINGVAMINPETITIGHNVIIEENVVIHPNTYITGNSVIKKGAQIGPNTEIHESSIGERVICRHSLVYNSIVHEDTTVGPFAHLRDGANIGAHNRIGNFVEVKKSSTGDNTKASHLAYIGDTTCGSHVNFGCGAVTVNYDGKQKYQTFIGDDVFIGCNVNLIAPIRIEDNSFIAAGSTLTQNVPKGSLAIARAYQVNKADYMMDRNGKDKVEK